MSDKMEDRIIEFAALEHSDSHEGYSSVGRWSPQQERYVEIRGEVFYSFEDAKERAAELNASNLEEQINQ